MVMTKIATDCSTFLRIFLLLAIASPSSLTEGFIYRRKLAMYKIFIGFYLIPIGSFYSNYNSSKELELSIFLSIIT